MISFWRPATCMAFGVAVFFLTAPQEAEAHHDGPVLPLSLNAPGAVGGLANPAAQTETKFGLASRAFRVSDHELYGQGLGGNATVLFNGLYGALALSPNWSLEALVPFVTDVPSNGHSHTGLGDVRMGLRWFEPLQRLGMQLMLGAETALPTGNADQGFGAGAAVSRVSTRLAKDLPAQRMRLFVETGMAWAWAPRRGTLADVAFAGMWQALGPVGLFCEVRVLTAVERGREAPLEFVGRTRTPGDTTVVFTPALMLAASPHISLALGPQIPVGFKDFDFGFALSATYRID